MTRRTLIKRVAKSVLNHLASVFVAPAVLCYFVVSYIQGPKRAFPGWSQLFSLVPGRSGEYLRRAFYRSVLTRCGEDSCISFGTIISHPTAEIGRSVYVGGYSILGDVVLQDNVIVASHVSIINGNSQHGIDRLDVPIREQQGVCPRITIGEDSWIGERSVIQANIGRHCVIGAGSVVVKQIPDCAVAVGTPARVIRFRDQSKTVRQVGTDLHEPAATSTSTIELQGN